MPVPSRYSPRSLEPAWLERSLIGHTQLVEQVQSAISGAVLGNQARFELLIGPRGIGKSHVLGVLEHRFRSAPQLLERALVVAPSEQLHPLSLVHLLALLLREFPEDPDLGPAEDSVRSLQRQRDGEQERRAVDLINARLDGRSLIIVLENLDLLFDALGRTGQLRLRNILQTQRRWSIVAGSRTLIPAFTKYEAPFHGTFNLHRLEPLSAEQCRDMLAALADAQQRTSLAGLLRSSIGLARVRGLHHLLGGNPRAMATVFRVLDEQRLDHFERLLAELADEITPEFREQLARVSPAQGTIMQVLAESWRPLTVAELAERTFSPQASVSGALRHLRRHELVQALAVGRERYYELADPLHRLARANGRAAADIVAFAGALRRWYAQEPTPADGAPRSYVPQARGQVRAADGNTTSIAADANVRRARSRPLAALAQLGPAYATLDTDPARREVFARLAAPERELVRAVLEAGGDRETLALLDSP